jgi:alanine racemase
VSSRAQARIDVGAIERNARRLLGRTGPRPRLCAVVKADGYGHGAVAVAWAAIAGGATWLAVATAGEAAHLRDAGLAVPILVLGPLDEADLAVAMGAGADMVAWTPEFVRRVAATGRGAGLHVKLDTGMGRLGARDPDDALALAALVDRLRSVRLTGAMTHFATADAPEDGFFARQLSAFAGFAARLRRDHPDVLIHAANSAATLREPAAHFDMVRCGIALYGLDPFQRDPADWELEPALELSSYIARLERIAPGEAVGYGRRYVAREPTWIATVPIGYADGVRRTVDGAMEVLVAGRRAPLAGTVSMDSLAVDLGAVTDAAVGDEVVLIGARGEARILAEELARTGDTINYEIVCALGPRVERLYAVGAGA